MTGLTSMHYAANLPTLLEEKRVLGHYYNPPIETAGRVFEADQGWDELFANFNVAPTEKVVAQRVGASAREKLNEIRKKVADSDRGVLPGAEDTEATLKIEE